MHRNKHPPVRVGLVHATQLAVEPALAAFTAYWPAARPVSLLDESLQLDAADPDYAGPDFADRIGALARYQVDSGARGLLFTCSAFSDAIKTAARALDVPVLRPDEAAIERALAIGRPVRILATFPPTLPVVRSLVAEFRDDPDQPVGYTLVDGALQALRDGDADRHDRLIAEAAAAAAEPVLVLAQYSMARASAQVERRAGREPITGPAHAVRMLRELVEGQG